MERVAALAVERDSDIGTHSKAGVRDRSRTSTLGLGSAAFRELRLRAENERGDYRYDDGPAVAAIWQRLRGMTSKPAMPRMFSAYRRVVVSQDGQHVKVRLVKVESYQ